jgi:signal transduction histidine kinase
MILSGKTPVKILLVDDQPANLLALEKILDGADYRLIRAKSGHEALERLEDDDFAVIVLDVQMPGLDGFATAKLIRARQRSRHTPIIFVSDHEAIEFPVGQEGAHEAVDYLVKPLVPAVLRARIKIFVDLFRLTRHVKKHLRAEESLKETNQRKDNFLAMLGHELRNALGPIRNAAQVLQLTEATSASSPKALEIIGRQVGHMARLIDDLLDVSRISRGKILLRKEPVDLVALARTTADDYRVTLKNSGLRLGVELPHEPLWVRGDATRLSQVLRNLLDNARKFTNTGGRIGLWLRRRGDMAKLSVSDTGIGIEPKMLGHVFDTFTQAEGSHKRSRAGLGLGLSLVKGLVELHDGTVKAASEGLGAGSKFTIRLPLHVAPEETRQTAPAPIPQKTYRVLIIDDNRDAVETMQILLELGGHVVDTAYTGREGIEAARQFPPEVVLCDIGLPDGMDGYDVARRLRKDPELLGTYLVAVSGYGQPDDQRRAKEAGFDLHMIKPVESNELQRVLAELPSRVTC